MRSLLLFVLFAVLSTPALSGQNQENPPSSQNCETPPSAQIDLAVNGVRARLTTGGDLWWDGQNGLYEVTADVNSPNVNPVSSIFAGGLWIGGMDPGGGLKIAAQQYGRSQGRFDYFPGPLTDEGVAFGVCEEWDKFFVITRAEINDYLVNFDPANPQDYQFPTNIAGWPATGNPLFEGIHNFALPPAPHSMAPFWDEDQDGIYDPRNGDYPLFCGDEAIWCVFNDGDNVHADSGIPSQVQAEVQLMAYAYASNDEELHRTTFYDYKIYNRAQEDVMDFYAGNWIDVDLGCFTDDLIGSDPEHNMFYVYNQNGIDRDPCDGGVASYRETAPVSIFQVVNTNLDDEPGEEDPLMHSVANIYNTFGSPPLGISDPRTATEYYSYLTGRWADGTPITRGGNGYETEGDTTLFVFDGGPLGNATWQHCTSNIVLADIRQVYSTGPYNLRPGQSAEFTLAITTIFGVDYPDGSCPDTDVIVAAAEKIKGIYDENCSRSVLTGTYQSLSPGEIGLVTFPNPTSGEVTFRLPEQHRIDKIEILDIAGRVQNHLRAGSNSHTFDLRLPAGTYIYRLTTTQGAVVAGRVVVLK
ncbi:T9SS type A sorting domain-containing protein [Neolewinella persica]|uniref:T9SS type A sorting domain-containing protein n=1 Tax=Neolewinella persica TaxID=70998 RepID=UPI000362FA11|nr:T9SS type A sorting domain-containing protein [Neolewinella persica]